VRSQLGEEAGEAGGLEAELEAVLQHVDALNQELQETGLLGRKELGPERIEPFEGIANLGLGQPVPFGLGGRQVARMLGGVTSRSGLLTNIPTLYPTFHAAYWTAGSEK